MEDLTPFSQRVKGFFDKWPGAMHRLVQEPTVSSEEACGFVVFAYACRPQRVLVRSPRTYGDESSFTPSCVLHSKFKPEKVYLHIYNNILFIYGFSCLYKAL